MVTSGHSRPLRIGSELPEKCGPVLFHRPLLILAGETQVQAPLAVSPGKPARPGAEAVNEPRQRRKRIGVENLALGFPEGFQRHRNILATLSAMCNAASCNKYQVCRTKIAYLTCLTPLLRV